MPRGENEALVDYATRLSEAVRALNPGERMAIERLLNQIVKGVTLRLLAEILNNPAGPDAARLAAYIEAASAGERDLAAKAVVSSYRQNGSVDSAPGGNAARNPAGTGVPAASTPAATGTPGATAPGTNAATSPAAPSSPSSTATGSQPVPQDGDHAILPTQADGEPSAQAVKPDEKLSEQGNRTERPVQGTDQHKSAADGTSAAARSQTAQNGHGAASPGLAGQTAGTARIPNAATPASAMAKSKDADVPASRDEATAAKGEGSRAKETRHVETHIRAPSVDGRAGLSNARLMLAELAGWMTGVATGTEPPAAATAKPASALQPASADQAIQENDVLTPEGATKQMAGTTRSADAGETLTTVRPAESQPAERAAASQTEKTELLDRQMAMLGGLPQATREGVPLPYVAYPPSEQEPEREERKARAIAEIGDEEGDAPAQDHGFHQDQQEQDSEDSSGEDGSEKGSEGNEGMAAKEHDLQADEDEGRPNDLYWRMAGWA
jgi:hypothetical protein